jgi:tRNA dimethylallyltransferase
MEADARLGKLPLVVIAGPTASGKTALAIEMAQRFGGEIICADSRTIYKGMDIGTAKPTAAEQRGVPHWGLDLVEPGDYFSAADFKRYAEEKIIEIRGRGNIPFLVGGTGLYVDSVVFDYQFGPQADPTFRAELEAMTLEALYDYCKQNSISLPENEKNKRYVIRAIEQKSINSLRREEPIPDCIIVGIATESELLRERIEKRSEQLFDDGVVDEAILLGKKYGWESEAMTGNIYPLVHAYLKKQMTLQDVKDKFTTLDWRLAKRQMTWLRRNQYIQWGNLSEVRERLLHLLANA